MSHPVFELRQFTLTDKYLPQDDTFTDLYLIKRGHTKIGIKIREPDMTSKGNYKFNKVQVKQLVKTVQGLQGWSKTKIKLEHKFKLKDDNLHELNKILKAQLLKLEDKTEDLQKWVDSPIDYAVQASKFKSKYGGNEKALVSFKRAFTGTKPIVMESWSVESQNPEHLFKTNQVEKVHNTSYPQILDRLFLTVPLI